MDARQLIETARARLILNQPFFGTLALYLRPEENNTVIDTCATDGDKLYFNRQWIEDVHKSEGMEAVMGVVCHEVMHAALGHIWRRGTREHFAWNASCDYAVNLIITDAGLKIPSGCLLDRRYDGMSAEEIYARLDHSKTSQQQWGDHSTWGQGGLGGSSGDGQGDSNESASHVPSAGDIPGKMEEWRSRVAAAAQAAKTRGYLPAGLSRLVNEILEPRISWREVLAEFLQPARNDYTYHPPDRRFVAEEVYIPDFGGQGVEDIVIAVDASGSISDEELSRFVAECKGILSMHGRSRVHLVACDAKVFSWETVESQDEWPKFNLGGGGGTDFRPVFNEVDERGIYPSVLVYLTDGYGLAPDKEPPYPVLWVLTPNSQEPARWGRVIKMLD